MMMNRRRLLALLGGTGAALSAGPAFGQSGYSVRIGTFASESTGAVFYAQDNGTFATSAKPIASRWPSSRTRGSPSS
jgi:hypothetical protein